MPVPSTLSKNDLSSPFFADTFSVSIDFYSTDLQLLICSSIIFPRIYQVFQKAILLSPGIYFLPFYLNLFFFYSTFADPIIWLQIRVLCFQRAVICIIQGIDIILNWHVALGRKCTKYLHNLIIQFAVLWPWIICQLVFTDRNKWYLNHRNLISQFNSVL